MPQYRRKPTIHEAVQFNPCGAHKMELPKGVEFQWGGHCDNYCYSSCRFFVTTIHGDRIEVFGGDWIVTEPDGEHYYPVKREIFEATYEPVN